MYDNIYIDEPVMKTLYANLPYTLENCTFLVITLPVQEHGTLSHT